MKDPETKNAETKNTETNSGSESGAEPPQNPLLAAALQYIKLGLSVFPCHTPTKNIDGIVSCSCRKSDCDAIGKHPRTRDGLKGASTDEAQIRSWWEIFPDANIGICTRADFVVIDIDTRDNGLENWEILKAKNEKLPDTVESITGSGGHHLLFRVDPSSGPEIRNSVNRVCRGVDVRGAGGYIVAPPSLHSSGRRYTWEASSDPGEVPVAQLPAWLAKLCRGEAPKHTESFLAAVAANGSRLATPGSLPVPAGASLGSGLPIPKGERDDTLFKLARSLRSKGFGEEAIHSAIAGRNRDCVDDAGKPYPLSDADIARIAKSACTVAPGTTKQQKAAAEAASGEAAGGLSLSRGDEAELASIILHDVRGDSPEPLIFDRDHFFRYHARLGIWVEVTKRELYVATLAYAGINVGEARKPKPLKLKSSTIKGTIDIATQVASDLGFFNSAVVGIAFTDYFVTVRNGVISALPHSPEHKALHAMQYAYDATAKCDRWLRFLEEIFTLDDEKKLGEVERADRAKDRADRICLLQEFMGACLIGDAVKHAVALVLSGDGSNGKSVFIKVVQALFPRQSVKSIAPQLWGNRFYLAELAGIRLNAVNELPDRNIGESELFKEVIGGDMTSAAKKNRDPFDLTPTAGHLFSCNNLPATHDQSEGFWRRLEVIMFERIFEEHEKNRELARELITNELAGIAAWAIEGAARLQRQGDGYTIPASSKRAKSEWRQSTDQVQQFWEECCRTHEADVKAGDVGDAQPEEYLTTSLEMYEMYRFWASRTGHEQMSQQKFWRRLAKVAKVAKGRSHGSAVRYPVRIIHEWLDRKRSAENGGGYRRYYGPQQTN